MQTEENVRQILDPSAQTLAYLHILCAHIEAARSASKASSASLPPAILFGGELWPRIAIFLDRFDPIQVRYGGAHFRFVLEIVCTGARQTQNVSRPLSEKPMSIQ
jgi:COP9 signalosome complex subunit 3